MRAQIDQKSYGLIGFPSKTTIKPKKMRVPSAQISPLLSSVTTVTTAMRKSISGRAGHQVLELDKLVLSNTGGEGSSQVVSETSECKQQHICANP